MHLPNKEKDKRQTRHGHFLGPSANLPSHTPSHPTGRRQGRFYSQPNKQKNRQTLQWFYMVNLYPPSPTPKKRRRKDMHTLCSNPLGLTCNTLQTNKKDNETFYNLVGLSCCCPPPPPSPPPKAANKQTKPKQKNWLFMHILHFLHTPPPPLIFCKHQCTSAKQNIHTQKQKTKKHRSLVTYCELGCMAWRLSLHGHSRTGPHHPPPPPLLPITPSSFCFGYYVISQCFLTNFSHITLQLLADAGTGKWCGCNANKRCAR